MVSVYTAESYVAGLNPVKWGGFVLFFFLFFLTIIILFSGSFSPLFIILSLFVMLFE